MTTNVVLITVDSLRSDAIDHEPGTDVTPWMARLSDRGTVFENAFAHGNWTPFSFPSILASRPVFVESDDIGVSGVTTLAEHLRDAGVTTAGFNAGNGFLTGHWGYDRGFDRFETFTRGREDGRLGRWIAAHPTVDGWLQVLGASARRAVGELRGGADVPTARNVSRMVDVERNARAVIREADGPFFLWVHYMDAHTPYFPDAPYLKDVTDDEFGRIDTIRSHLHTGLGKPAREGDLARLWDLYRGAIRQIDESVGRLLQSIESRDDETCVVLTSDHGEEFHEHGNLGHYPKLYDELVHVPLLIDHPEGESRTVRESVGLQAVAPTVAEAMGVRPPETWEGASLLETVLEGSPPETGPVVSVTVRGESVTTQPIPRHPAAGNLLVSARTNEWVFIEDVDGGACELYRRADEPGSRDDLWNESVGNEDETVETLRNCVYSHAARIDGAERPERDPAPELETTLAALGYR